MTRFKKILAAGAAIVCAAALTGCSDNGYIMNVEGIDIRNGIYLSGVMSAYGDAYEKVSEAREEQGLTSEVEDLFKESIDGKPVSDWVKEEALNQVKRSVAIQKLCEENGIALSDEEANEINAEINQMWTEESFYAQYLYGTDTMGEYYDGVGIGKDSLRESFTVSNLYQKLFMHYYGEGGLTPVSDADLNTYLKENYASAFVLELKYTDYQGILLTDDDEIDAVKLLAQSYADRINGGESIADIKYEYDLKTAQDEARTDAEDDYPDLSEAEKPATLEEYVQQMVDAATAEKAESDSELFTHIKKESSSFSTEITDFIWGAEANGKAGLFETTNNSICVIIRNDITTESEWKEENNYDLLSEIKSDEFEDTLKAVYEGYTVNAKENLINGKYSPEKIKGIN
ncbi:MAG: hypothetical protein KIG62_10315 [Oscillospiraceae bacterium]|nr:hypothetical protein [Oscillospiraceae bacterium]